MRADYLSLNRRDAVTSLLAAASALQAQETVRIAGKRSMIVHNDRPEDLETPLAHFAEWLTPNDVFFVRQHLPRPRVNETSFRLTINGRVSREVALTAEDLRKLPQTSVTAVLECTGNGRAFFSPRVAGVQWGRGAVGNAEWSGPKLLDVLKLAGADLESAYVTVNGADVGIAKTPDFVRSLPMRKAVHPATLLALKMNGETLPQLHGFPLRLIVPGWDGTSWVKWVSTLTVSNEQDNGFYMNPAYRFPRNPVPPGVAANPAELEVIEDMPVKSYITGHEDGEKIAAAPVVLRGMAWAGEQHVVKVEVSTDGGATWSPSSLTPQTMPYTWRLWTYEWKPKGPGYYTIMSRATDSAGRSQPIVATWNPSGYLFNAIDRIGLTVTA